ncbi:MAG: formylmethanofuran dehydrogenase [Anaerolineae bacterium]|nr:MAG: formylmethanofuran dehydrogenase [Anaerolineae bacterium]WKZ43507.1 MAG: FmdE family protein [Anaerolineales bacterium]
MDLKPFLDLASRDHRHLCPRQILGVRIGLKGLAVHGMDALSTPKHLLVVSETDGCFVDGVIAVTNCTVGHRNLRIEDYGKIAATFINTKTNYAVRIAPALDVREKAYQYAPEEKRHYFAQMQAYQTIPDEELLTVQEVELNFKVEEIISHAGKRVNCERCGEEIINEREVLIEGKIYCRFCAEGGYYQSAVTN